MAPPSLKLSTNDTLHGDSNVKGTQRPKGRLAAGARGPQTVNLFLQRKKGTVAEMPGFVTALTMIIQMMKILQHELTSL